MKFSEIATILTILVIQNDNGSPAPIIRVACPLSMIARCPDGSIPIRGTNPATGCPSQTCPGVPVETTPEPIYACPLVINGQCPDGSTPTQGTDPTTGCPTQTCPSTPVATSIETPVAAQ